MNTILHLLVHILGCLTAVNIVWLFNPNQVSVNTFIFAFIGGLLIDLDHLIDYVLAFGIKGFRVDGFLKGMSFAKTNKIYVFFHSYELLLIIICCSFLMKNKSLLILSISYLIHLVIDVYVNEVKLISYSLWWRIKSNFELVECKM